MIKVWKSPYFGDEEFYFITNSKGNLLKNKHMPHSQALFESFSELFLNFDNNNLFWDNSVVFEGDRYNAPHRDFKFCQLIGEFSKLKNIKEMAKEFPELFI